MRHGDAPLPIVVETIPHPPLTPNYSTLTPTTPTTTSTEVDLHFVIVEKPLIKSKLLATQAQSVTTMLRILENGSMKRNKLLEARILVAKSII